MSVFSDDDLKRLKELLDDQQASGFFTEDMARRILARLSAAEANMGGHSVDCPKVIGKCICTKESRDKAWRAAAGK